MKATFTVSSKTFTVSAKFKGDKPAQWSMKGLEQNWNNHRVTVACEKRATTFDFWASIAHPMIESESDLFGAFECFVMDAMSGESDFEGFCSESGYDTDSRKAAKIHKACRKANANLRRVFNIEGDELYDFCNAVNEGENA